MSLFVSIVGKQTAAIATSLAAWKASGEQTPRKIILLASTEVRDRSESDIAGESLLARLHQWIEQNVEGTAVEVIDIDVSPESGPAICDALFRHLEATRRDAEQVIVNGASGPNWLVALLAGQLTSPFTWLYPDSGSLQTFTRHEDGTVETGRTELMDLGLEPLCTLYGLQIEKRNAVSKTLAAKLDNPDSVAQDIILRSARGQFQMDFAREKRGGLLGLCRIEKQDAQAPLQTLRQLLTVKAMLGHLQPRLTIASSDEPTRIRAQQAGMNVINTRPGRNVEELWSDAVRWATDEAMTTPRAGLPIDRRTPPISRWQRADEYRGSGGDGPPLLVCLGNDPSSTLVSLQTHRPRQAICLFDRDSASVVRTAENVSSIVSELPVDSLILEPMGRDRRRLVELLLKTPLPDGSRIDITPGTKFDTFLMSVFGKHELWSLDPRSDRARRLPSNSNAELTLSAPEITTQATACGGPLNDHGRSVSSEGEASNCGFYMGLASLLADQQNAYRAISKPDRFDNIAKGLLDGRISREKESREGVEYRLKTTPGSSAGPVGIVPYDSGNWFELLVAYALVEAGADDVRCNIKIAWSSHEVGTEHFKNEIDVVGRIGHRFVAISCKSGNKLDAGAAMREIHSVANDCLGRFCLPVLARPYLKQAEEHELARRQIDLNTLSDPEVFRAFLENEFNKL